MPNLSMTSLMNALTEIGNRRAEMRQGDRASRSESDSLPFGAILSEIARPADDVRPREVRPVQERDTRPEPEQSDQPAPRAEDLPARPRLDEARSRKDEPRPVHRHDARTDDSGETTPCTGKSDASDEETTDNREETPVASQSAEAADTAGKTAKSSEAADQTAVATDASATPTPAQMIAGAVAQTTVASADTDISGTTAADLAAVGVVSTPGTTPTAVADKPAGVMLPPQEQPVTEADLQSEQKPVTEADLQPEQQPVVETVADSTANAAAEKAATAGQGADLAAKLAALGADPATKAAAAETAKSGTAETGAKPAASDASDTAATTEAPVTETGLVAAKDGKATGEDSKGETAGNAQTGEAASAKSKQNAAHPVRTTPFADMLPALGSHNAIYRPADILAGLDRALPSAGIQGNGDSRALRPTPLQMLPIEIGMQAVRGVTNFQIRLDPAELGRVDVKLEIKDNGEVNASLVVDRVETLQMLKRDASTLQQAFEQAGLKQSPDGLNFSLRGDGQQGQQQERNRQNGAETGLNDLGIQQNLGELVMRRALIPNTSLDLMI